MRRRGGYCCCLNTRNRQTPPTYCATGVRRVHSVLSFPVPGNGPRLGRQRHCYNKMNTNTNKHIPKAPKALPSAKRYEYGKCIPCFSKYGYNHIEAKNPQINTEIESKLPIMDAFTTPCSCIAWPCKIKIPEIQLYTILNGRTNKLTGMIFSNLQTPSTKVSDNGPPFDSLAAVKDLQQNIDFPNNPNVLNNAVFSGFLTDQKKKRNRTVAEN